MVEDGGGNEYSNSTTISSSQGSIAVSKATTQSGIMEVSSLSITTTTAATTTTTTTEPYIVLPGPEDVSIYLSDGLYQQSVTLTARMWPPIEAGSPKIFWGLPAIIWCVLIGCILLFLLILAALFLCCWLLPRRRKVLSPTRYNNNCANVSSGRGVIMAQHSAVVTKPWKDSTYIVMPTGIVPPQYTAPPKPMHQEHYNYSHHNDAQSASIYSWNGGSTGVLNGGCRLINSNNNSSHNIPDVHHKSMWAVNPLYASNSIINETDSAYRTRSLPAWGKVKQRPVSTTDDLEELYAKVNFSKKRKNRMRNGEAAIIALCRSRSQNLQGMSLEREGVVVYDERTAL